MECNDAMTTVPCRTHCPQADLEFARWSSRRGRQGCSTTPSSSPGHATDRGGEMPVISDESCNFFLRSDLLQQTHMEIAGLSDHGNSPTRSPTPRRCSAGDDSVVGVQGKAVKNEVGEQGKAMKNEVGDQGKAVGGQGKAVKRQWVSKERQ